MQRPKPPEEITPLEKPEIEEGGKKKFKLPTEGLTGYAVMLIIAVAVSFVMTSYFGVSKTDFTKNIGDIVKSISSANADIRAIKDSVTTAIADIPKTIKSETDSTINAINSRLITLDSAVNESKNKIDTANTNSQEALKQANAYSKTISELQATINSLNTKVTDLQALANSNKAEITALKTKIDSLSTSTSTTSTTTNKVTASIVGNVFTGDTTMAFGIIPPGGTESQTMSIQVDNQTGKELTSLQLALLLYTTSGGSNYSLPASSAITVTSSNLAMIWTAQNTGVPYLKGFISGTTSGFTSIFGTTVTNQGVTTYNLTVTIKNNSTTAEIPAMVVYPQVTVVKYTER